MRYAKPFILFVLCTLFSMQSFAQASSADIKQALALIKGANDNLETKNYAAALKGYEKAYALYPTEVLLFRMGLSNDKLGNKKEAISFYEQYLASGKANDKLKKISKTRLEELKKPTTVLVSISSQPTKAKIYSDLNGNPIGTTPQKLNLPPGKQTVFVKMDGYEVYELELEVIEGKDRGHVVTLVPLAAADGLLATDDTERTLDGPDTIEAPETESGILTKAGWAAVGIGAGVLIGGGVMAFLSFEKETEANDYNKRAPGATRTELQELRDSATSFSDISTILFISGGVAVAGGAAMILLDSGSERQTAINVLPLKNGAAVGFSTHF